MLIHASITAQLVTFATNVVHDLGYAGVTLMIVMSQVVIVPGTEATMLFAGFNVDTHNLTLIGIIVAGVLGDVIGASICYAIGYFGLHEALARPGSPVHIDVRKIELTHRWFERYGAPVVAVSRVIPVFRSVPPYAAGIARMPYWRFVSMATLGSIVWITGWALVGKAVGHQWQQWKHHLDYVDYAVVAIVVVLVVWFLVRWIRNRRTPTPAA
ncbi:MAG TPA: DedA family protein [Solirubrobacteraceae bacterium]|nr:DedA family protein [Solirubrobacteraceae bacterium]